METIALYAVTAVNVLAAAFCWFTSSGHAGVALKIRSLERTLERELEDIRQEIPKAEISLAGQILEATELVETVRHAQKKMAGRQKGKNAAQTEGSSYLDESLPREVRHRLMKEQLGV